MLEEGTLLWKKGMLDRGNIRELNDVLRLNSEFT